MFLNQPKITEVISLFQLHYHQDKTEDFHSSLFFINFFLSNEKISKCMLHIYIFYWRECSSILSASLRKCRAVILTLKTLGKDKWESLCILKWWIWNNQYFKNFFPSPCHCSLHRELLYVSKLQVFATLNMRIKEIKLIPYAILEP